MKISIEEIRKLIIEEIEALGEDWDADRHVVQPDRERLDHQKNVSVVRQQLLKAGGSKKAVIQQALQIARKGAFKPIQTRAGVLDPVADALESILNLN